MAEGVINQQIIVQVQGKQEVVSLNQALRENKLQMENMAALRGRGNQLIRAETTATAKSLANIAAKNRASSENITLLAQTRNAEEDQKKVFKERMMVEQRALRIQKKRATEGTTVTLAAARTQAAAEIEQQRAIQMTEVALQKKRRALMQASISLFVLNISANQMITSLKPLVKGNEEATESLNQLSATLSLSLGPMQTYLAIQQLMINLTIAQRNAVIGVVGSFFGLFLIFKAITTHSKLLKVVFGALGGALLAVAAKHIIAAKAAWAQATATSAAAAAGGDFTSGIRTVAVGALVGGAFGGILAAIQGAQTRPGQTKRVPRSQLKFVHEGEIERPLGSGTRDGGGDIIQVMVNGDVTEDNANRLARAIIREKNAGRSRKATRSFA